ncbi:MAG: hypothetical protein RL748_3788 [Pseudomonadota bacterium]|jgi:amidase
MAGMAEYDDLDGMALASLIRERQVSAEEVLAACLSRVEQRNPALNAVTLPMPELALQQARGPLPSGPLSGVPIFIKDLLADIAGVPTTNGSRMFANWVPPQDAGLTRRYRQAGLIFAAKTATPEFGLMPYTETDLFGATRNPWNPALTPGGSSGGSAAAVAARMGPIGHGGDGGGSIRIPASNCGLFGLKPSRGRTPFGPLFSESWQGMVEQHALTRSVRDSAAMLDIQCAGYDSNDTSYCPAPTSSFLSALDTPCRPLRIAYTDQPFLGGTLDSECRAAMQHSLKLLEQLGHHVEQAHPPLGDPEQMCRAMLVMVSGEMAGLVRNSAKVLGRRATWRDMEPGSWAMACNGEILSAGEFAWMRAFILEQGRIMSQFHRNWDVLVTPVLNQPPAAVGALAPSALEMRLSQLTLGRLGWSWLLRFSPIIDDNSRRMMAYLGWTIPFNMSGQPSASVPLYWRADNIPLGTQLTAAHGNDALLLQLSHQLEQAQPWGQRRPVL